MTPENAKTPGVVTAARSAARTLVVRLEPGRDLRLELLAVLEREGIEAAYVATCVGSLDRFCLRFAGESEGTSIEGAYEILALVGTLSRHGCHLHASLGDGSGATTGGHVLAGCRVRTTAEVVLGVLDDLVFTREHDEATGYPELVVRPRPA